MVGATGVFQTQEIIPAGNTLVVSYQFKLTDTLKSNESLAAQIPAFAAITLTSTTSEAIQESHVVPSSPPGPVTVTNSSTFTGNVGVQYAATGIFLTKVASAPAQGQYAVTAGVYTFNTADAGAAVLISYSYTNASTAQSLAVSLTIPGFQGNNVTLALTLTPGSGKSDALSISGVGTDAISIELLKADNATVRTLANVNTLISAGIPTALGYLTGTLTGSGANQALAQAATALTGGQGPNTNTVFQTHYAPIVDGTNGGIVTTSPSSVVVLVNGLAATVSAVDGQSGQVTLANPVAFGSTLTITYYTNNYQHTNDLLPAKEVASIVQVGLGPNRSDYIQGIDYVLTQNGTQIAWGANVDTTAWHIKLQQHCTIRPDTDSYPRSLTNTSTCVLAPVP